LKSLCCEAPVEQLTCCIYRCTDCGDQIGRGGLLLEEADPPLSDPPTELKVEDLPEEWPEERKREILERRRQKITVTRQLG
jgi:hypothetical protein